MRIIQFIDRLSLCPISRLFPIGRITLFFFHLHPRYSPRGIASCATPLSRLILHREETKDGKGARLVRAQQGFCRRANGIEFRGIQSPGNDRRQKSDSELVGVWFSRFFLNALSVVVQTARGLYNSRDRCFLGRWPIDGTSGRE